MAPRGILDHNPILLELAGAKKKPPIPFKFNPFWLDSPSYLYVIKECWVPYKPHLLELPSIQFKENLKGAKETSISWNKNKEAK